MITNSNNFHELQTFNSEKSSNHLSDAIFSPYTNYNEGNLNSHPFIMSNKKSPLNQLEKKQENGEIGVFGAERYFNVGEVETPRSPYIASATTTKYLHHQRDEQVGVNTRKYQLQYGTPSILSESTSNSQSALLQSKMMRNKNNSSMSRKDKGQTKSVLSGFGFKCSCSDKDSVDAGEVSFSKSSTSYASLHRKTTSRKLIDIAALDATHSIKICKPNPELLKINREKENNTLPFSTLSPPGLGNQNHLVKMQFQIREEEEDPRKSLEVFGSPVLSSNKSRTKSLSIDRRLTTTMSSRDYSAPRIEEIDSSYVNDAASDASSDLFEIESIKSKTNPFLARQASDAASSCMSPTTGYAPSEASIEWSVVTASAAVMSDCEEQMSEVTIRSPIRTQFTSSNGKAKNIREVQRVRRPSMLLGCKSHKAVRVAGDAFITYEKPSKTNTSQVARFPSESKIGNFGARHGQGQHQHAYATPTHASKLLYI
ncbi:hypothetical protein RJT34_02678 [Clitoria ternatea]|uniref:Uncharacterized protein n=1 Tax=Clitoria ternatea TaxID=43366 RepID=A0AAN9KKS8_CLITE